MKINKPTSLSVFEGRENATVLPLVVQPGADVPLGSINKNGSYTTALVLNRSPEEVFGAINEVRKWWSEEIEGCTDQSGARFTIHFNRIHRSTHKITECVPGKRVVWHVPDASINFVKDKDEWNGTDIVFEILKKSGRTELCFTHVGLVPRLECYDGCSEAWDFYINESLRRLIMTGQGEPNQKETRKKGGREIIGAAASM